MWFTLPMSVALPAEDDVATLRALLQAERQRAAAADLEKAALQGELEASERRNAQLEQIIAVLREQEAGAATADVCRRHGISSATFYKWKAKFGGLDVSDAKRLRALEDENAKLKKLLAEAMLDNAILKDVNSRKW